jgi:hypothetical protein
MAVRREILRRRFIRIRLLLVVGVSFIYAGSTKFGFFYVGMNFVMFGVGVAGFDGEQYALLEGGEQNIDAPLPGETGGYLRAQPEYQRKRDERNPAPAGVGGSEGEFSRRVWQG